MRIFFMILVFVFALEQYHLWWGKNGMQENKVLVKEVDLAIKSNAELMKRNQLMFAEIDDLRQGNEAIEERARNELGLIKEGETFFRIVPKKH
ncbi:septum formation initiator [Psychromonas sp. CNPT3]|uniref:cell division protein FtsB n=1 Tax=Psychromonas sp. CNPT3 TaxID=314282 RepID=UPI00006E5851|nr:cell division protein FtsB [Psychromonas sp. CNPT3]AGH81949.1 septum formation initiator [Psychromonas sp. CNPT3]